LATDSASRQGLRQTEAEATALFEVGRFLNGAGRLATLSENLPLCPGHLFPQPPRAPPRGRTRVTQVLKKQFMAVKRHLRGASSKEQRQNEHIKKSARPSGRYGKRAKVVAARTAMKQHRKKKKSR
jgi:hypothetical protein